MGTNGAHHGEVSLRQVLVEREAVASSSLVGSGGQDPIGELLLVQEAHGPELTVEEPGYDRLVLTLLSRQDMGLLYQLLSSRDVLDSSLLQGPLKER